MLAKIVFKIYVMSVSPLGSCLNLYYFYVFN